MALVRLSDSSFGGKMAVLEPEVGALGKVKAALKRPKGENRSSKYKHTATTCTETKTKTHRVPLKGCKNETSWESLGCCKETRKSLSRVNYNGLCYRRSSSSSNKTISRASFLRPWSIVMTTSFVSFLSFFSSLCLDRQDKRHFSLSRPTIRPKSRPQTIGPESDGQNLHLNEPSPDDNEAASHKKERVML